MTITGTYVLTRRTCTSTFASEHIPPHRQGYISMILLSTNLTAEPSGADTQRLRQQYKGRLEIRSSWSSIDSAEPL